MHTDPASPDEDDTHRRGHNRRTVQAYEGYARQYAAAVAQVPDAVTQRGLRAIAALAPGGRVLEVGSGPGWDADFAESLGLAVRRTDATEAFLGFQAERGKRADALDLIADPLGGPYDAVVALCVLLHLERAQVAPVLRKVADTLRPGGAFLVSLRLGEGEHWEGDARDYRVVLWQPDAFLAALHGAGLSVDWEAQSDERDGRWLTAFARRPE